MSAHKEYEILHWARQKGILDYQGTEGMGTIAGQHQKTLEEVSELTDAICQKNVREIKDAIGDIYVTLVIQAHMQGLTMTECIDAAYNEIKNRKGNMVNGQFVKSEAQQC